MKQFNEYQEFTKSLARYNTDVVLMVQTGSDKHGTHYSEVEMPYLYPAMACAEEAGEVAGKIAKFVRKSLTDVPDAAQLKLDVAKELGDLLYQVSECSRMFGYTLEEIVRMNVAKLQDRADRGVLIGEGDNR